MADDGLPIPGNYDPKSYINPDYARAQMDYAKAMMTGPGQQKVGHWTQGLSNMVNALMGGRNLYNTGQAMNQSDIATKKAGEDFIKGGLPGAPPPPNPQLGALQPPQQAAPSPQQASPPGSPETTGQGEEGSLPGLPGIMGSPLVQNAEKTANSILGNTPEQPAQYAQALGGKKPTPEPPMPPPGSPQVMDPSLLPRPLPFDRNSHNLLGVLLSRMDPKMKEFFVRQAFENTQAQAIDVPGGKLYYSRDGQTQKFVPTPKDTSLKIEGAGEFPIQTRTPTLGGQLEYNMPSNLGSLGDIGGGGGGAAPPPPDLGPAPAKAEVPPGAAPGTPPGASPGPAGPLGTPPPGVPNQVVPRAGLGTQPPAPPPAPPPPPPPPTAAPVQSPAQQQSGNVIQDLANMGQQLKAKQAIGQEEAKEVVKSSDSLMNHAIKAQNSMRDLGLLREIVANPNFNWGTAVGARVEGQRLLRTLQDLGVNLGANPNSVTWNDLFGKMRSGAVLDSLQSNLADQNLGRILQAEVNILQETLASAKNTPEANQAVIELNMKAMQKVADIGKVVTGYRDGYRLNNEGNWKTDANGRPFISNKAATNTEMKSQIQNYLENRPSWKEGELTSFVDRITKANGPEWGKKEGAPNAPNAPKKGFFDALFGTAPSATPEEALRRKQGQ